MKFKIAILIISAVVAVLVHFPELISLTDIHDHASPFANMRLLDVAVEVVYLFLTLILLFLINSVIFGFNDPMRKIGWRQLLASFVGTWAVNNLLGVTFVQLHQWFNIPAIDSQLHHYLHPLRDFLIAFIVTGGSYILHMTIKQHNILLENQLLRTENLRNQYESLKNQLNPHMFFNSLNTLNSLIRESPERAQIYVQELSKVLRYTLQPSDSRGVALSQELTFIHGYNYILKSRYEETLNFEIEINPTYNNHRLPPMALQMLIENAVKHNEISSRKPLTIKIYTNSDATITVSNRIQPKINRYQDTGIGLINLSKRYQLLFKEDIDIVSQTDEYTVRLPLVE